MPPPSLGWLLSFHILFQLLSFADAQFNIGYYSTSDCSAFSPSALFCRDYRSLQCCERPPGSDIFIAAQVTSGGPPGITCYHNPTSFGTCWTLHHTNPINSCDRNVPFKPVTVLGIDDINNAKSNGDTTYQQIGSIDMGDFLPLPFSPRDVSSGEESAPATNTTQCSKTNALTFANSRTVYRMTEDHHTEAFMHEFMNQTEAYMVEKYNLEIDPATYDPTFWGAHWDEVKDLPVFGQDNAGEASTNSAAPTPSARQQSRTSQVSVSSVGVKDSVAPASAGVQSSQGRGSAALWQDGQSTTLARLVSQTESASAEQSKSS